MVSSVSPAVTKSRTAGKKKSKTNPESLRRWRLSQLTRLFNDRYGPHFPDDDAGQDDLEVLLYPVSLHPTHAVENMTNIIETKAPWLQDADGKINAKARSIIADITNLPLYWRKPNGREVGERVRLTNAKREELKLWQMLPMDMSDEQLAEHNKTKKRNRETLRRRKDGIRPRVDYLAEAKAKKTRWKSRNQSFNLLPDSKGRA